MIFTGERGKPWGRDESRSTSLVFMGLELKRDELHRMLTACLATDDDDEEENDARGTPIRKSQKTKKRKKIWKKEKK